MTSRLKNPSIDFERYLLHNYQDIILPYTLEVRYDTFTMELVITLIAPKHLMKDTGAIFSISKKIEYADELTSQTLNFLVIGLKKEMDNSLMQMEL